MPSVLHRAESGPWADRVSWTWWEAVGVVAGAFVLAGLIRSRVLNASSTLAARVLGQILVEVAWLLIVAVWLGARRHDGRALLGRAPRPVAEAVDAAVFGAVLNGIVSVAVVLPFRTILAGSPDVAQGPTRDVTEMAPAAAAAFLAFVLVVAPVAEELVFRGVVFRGVRDRQGVLPGVAVSALAFGAVHWVPFAQPAGALLAVSTAAMGIGLAIQYERRRTLLAPIVAHVAFNVVGLLAAFR